ncbi:MAG: hypothetical protein QOG75_3450 [Mycobacterium sp.]|nr:hypothetical protein [Mycobacterium sp.]
MPDIFRKFPQFETDPAAYYRAYPEFSQRAEREPVHPQIVAENAPDSARFEYVHHATVTPRVLDWKIVDHEWQFIAGWPDAASDNPEDLAFAVPLSLVRPRRSDQPLRGRAEPSADFHLHAGRRRVFGPLLLDLVATNRRR